VGLEVFSSRNLLLAHKTVVLFFAQTSKWGVFNFQKYIKDTIMPAGYLFLHRNVNLVV